MSENKKQRWFSTGYLRAAPAGTVDRERGIIEGVSVCTVGEAKGHGVSLDQEFIETVTAQGNEPRKGVKARFGHPNMCSTALGSFIGRFKNFRTVGDQAKADLFLSNEAKDTPHGNLYDYVLGMAENEPDMFGTSIVFTPGKEYVRDEEGEKVYDFHAKDHMGRPVALLQEYADAPIFVECERLHACDAVDEPAANDGLFSAFSKQTIAGQITEFLDLNPQVFDALQGNPNVIEALAQYGDKIDEFITAYRDYRGENKEEETMSEEILSEEQEETVDLKSAEPQKEEVEEETNLESAEAEQVEEATQTENAEPEEVETKSEESSSEEDEGLEDIDRDEFTRTVEEFGALHAAKAFCNGGGYAEAQAEYIKALEAENAELKKNREAGASPVKFSQSDTPTAKPLFKTGK